MNIKINDKNRLSPTLLSFVLSILFTFTFAIYNLYLSISYRYSFSIAIFIYYFLIILIKSATLLIERNIRKKSGEIKQRVRVINYIISSILVFVMDLCLIAPVILMVTQPREFKFGLIPALVFATYAVYKITMSIINYRRSKRTKNLTIILFREINIIEAIVSILTLQNILIIVNGGMDDSMRMLSFITSVAFIVLIIIFSIISFIKNKRANKDFQN